MRPAGVWTAPPRIVKRALTRPASENKEPAARPPARTIDQDYFFADDFLAGAAGFFAAGFFAAAAFFFATCNLLFEVHGRSATTALTIERIKPGIYLDRARQSSGRSDFLKSGR
jgi:hypothetical protein